MSEITALEVEMKSFLGATINFLQRRARMSVLERLAREWRFLNSDLIPEAYLVELLPGINQKKVQVSADIRHPFELPYGERLVLAALIQHLQPKRVFEFGTYSGSTTVLIADSLPEDGLVTTLDLPQAELAAAGINANEIGQCFAGQPAYSDKIVSLRENSRVLDISRFERQTDLVFIDGSHQYDDVLRDSRNALRMVKPGGFIVWDDYLPACLPVAAALDYLSSEVKLRRIAQTRLVLYGPH